MTTGDEMNARPTNNLDVLDVEPHTEIINIGINIDEFREKYFEIKPLLIRKAICPAAYSWQDLTRDFYGIEPALAQVRIFKNGPLARAEFTRQNEELAQLNYIHEIEKIEELVKNGASIVINRFDKVSVYAGQINNHLRKFIQSLVVGNAYITRGGTGTFGSHWDTHCVFATQLKGRKKWRLFYPTQELPLFLDTSKKAKEKGAAPEILYCEHILEEGDILYIPRGWWHDVTPIDGQHSMHIAFGIHTIKVHDYIKWLVARKMQDHPTYHRSLDNLEERESILLDALSSLTNTSMDVKNMEDYTNDYLSQLTPKRLIDFKSIMES